MNRQQHIDRRHGDGVHRLSPGDRVLVSCISACGTCQYCREGPVGLSAIASARLFSPSRIVAVDLSDARLEAARHFGADITINDAREDPVAVIKELTGQRCADVAIEAVGTAATFETAGPSVHLGGTMVPS